MGGKVVVVVGGVEITLTIPLVGAVFAVHFLVTAPVLWDAVTITSAHEVANRALMVCKCNHTRKHNWLLSESFVFSYLPCMSYFTRRLYLQKCAANL